MVVVVDVAVIAVAAVAVAVAVAVAATVAAVAVAAGSSSKVAPSIEDSMKPQPQHNNDITSNDNTQNLKNVAINPKQLLKKTDYEK